MFIAESIGCFEFIQQKKTAGKAKKIGFSFHGDAILLDKILTLHPQIDVVQIQLNYLDWENYVIQSRLCYEVCVKHNKPVIVMEPVKGGTLASLPPEAYKLIKEYAPDSTPTMWALRFVAGCEQVITVLSGMSSLDQVRENVTIMKNFKPLSREELDILDEVRKIVAERVAVPCTGCSYCTDGCPKEIPIPKYLQELSSLFE